MVDLGLDLNMIGVLGFFCCRRLQEFVAFEGVGGFCFFSFEL